ncbi:MAG: ArsR family transcriptional regulator [Candidatus Aminicenantes bacterium]|nr:ArsR family transcriptional regulator [Candidatus Aminicenantes bacterium]
MAEEHISIKLNRVFHQKARLGIMSILMVMEDVEFNYLKERLKLSDGNLSTHLSILEQEKYIKIKKKFVKKKPKTLCQLTGKGHNAFVEYIDNLEKIIKNVPGIKKK